MRVRVAARIYWRNFWRAGQYKPAWRRIFFADIRFALRSFRRSPVFTVVAVLSLALGIGANTAIFTLVNQLILRLLPVRAPEELVLMAGARPPLRQQQRP